MTRSLFILLLSICLAQLKAQSPLIDVDGNAYVRERLGIGTDDPQQDLHIKGGHVAGITIQRESGNSQGIFWKDPENKVETAVTYNNIFRELRFFNGGTDRMYIDASGNLRLGGFGTIQPQVRLFVNGGFALGESFDESTPPDNGAIIEGNVGIGSITPDAKLSVTGSMGKPIINSDTYGGEPALQVNENGFVGIGTDITASPLSIEGTAADNTPDISILSNDALIAMGLGTHGPHGFVFGDDTANEGMKLLYRTGPNQLRIESGNDLSTGIDPIMAIENNGHVGIGTDDPRQRLHVAQGGMLLTPQTNGSTFIQLASDPTGLRGPIVRPTSKGIVVDKLDLSTSQNERIVEFETDGSTIQGTSSFDHLLTVNNKSIAQTAKGILVDLNVNFLDPDNHYMTFSHKSKIRGKIHGQETLVTLSRDLINDMMGSNPTSNNDPGANASRDQTPDESDQPILDFIGSNYGQELCWHTIELIQSIIELIANSFSVLDPDDFAAQGYAVISQAIKWGVFIAIEEITAGIAYESEGADYAEWLPKANPREVISAGDVVGVKHGVISKEFNDATKYMVISHRPMVIGNMPEESAESSYEKVAFIGQTLVKVVGDVSKGDFIIPSGLGDGLAQAVHPLKMKTKDYQKIIGTAWSDGDSTQFINLINTAVGINTNELANKVGYLEQLVDHMQRTLTKLDPSYIAQYISGDEHSDFSNKVIDQTDAISLLSQVQRSGSAHLGVAGTPQEIIKDNFNYIYEQLRTQDFDFSYFPGLESILKNPTPENLKKAEVKYRNALDNFKSVLATID